MPFFDHIESLKFMTRFFKFNPDFVVAESKNVRTTVQVFVRTYLLNKLLKYRSEDFRKKK